MDNREYARQEQLSRIHEQENCGSHPSAHLWQDAYRETISAISKEQKSSAAALNTVGNYINEQRTDSAVQAMLGVGGAAFAITAVVVESPVLIGAASLGAVACGGGFIWSGANSTMKHYTGKDLRGQ